jgi:CheY-like chemotaxis protein
MSTTPFGDDRLIFRDEPVGAAPATRAAAWRLLIADDDPLVQQSTRLALSDVEIAGRPLDLLQAHSAREARDILRDDPGIDLLLLDVVMESEDAGWRLVPLLREELGNRDLRIVIRTGQAGRVREEEIRARKDIDAFLNKAQITRAWLVEMLAELLGTERDPKAGPIGETPPSNP